MFMNNLMNIFQTLLILFMEVQLQLGLIMLQDLLYMDLIDRKDYSMFLSILRVILFRLAILMKISFLKQMYIRLGKILPLQIVRFIMGMEVN